MTVEARIANLAVMNCGKSSNIITLDEGTPEANYCKNAIDQARHDVLRDFDWNFSSQIRALSTSDEDPPPNWLQRYQYPKDALAVREIIRTPRNAPEPPWQILLDAQKRKSIVTDVEKAFFRISVDVMNYDIFDPLALTALSSRLAWYISRPLGLKRKEKSDILQEYIYLINEAKTVDANESTAEEGQPAEWHEARR